MIDRGVGSNGALPTGTLGDFGGRARAYVGCRGWWMTGFIAFVNLAIKMPIIKFGQKITVI